MMAFEIMLMLVFLIGGFKLLIPYKFRCLSFGNLTVLRGYRVALEQGFMVR